MKLSQSPLVTELEYMLPSYFELPSGITRIISRLLVAATSRSIALGTSMLPNPSPLPPTQYLFVSE